MSRIRQSSDDNGPVVLDELDRQIVSALQRDGRRPYSRIAGDVGISESVIRYRVERLRHAGILQIVGIADPLKVGFDLMALVGARVVPGKLDEVAAAIATLPETSYVASIAGAFDLIVEVVCRDTAHFAKLLTQQIHRMEGISSTESFLIMKIHKMAYGWDVHLAGEWRRQPIYNRPGRGPGFEMQEIAGNSGETPSTLWQASS